MLEEVLKEVISDQGALAKIWDTLGVRPSYRVTRHLPGAVTGRTGNG
jgi:hypothetical protein